MLPICVIRCAQKDQTSCPPNNLLLLKVVIVGTWKERERGRAVEEVVLFIPFGQLGFFVVLVTKII